MPPPLRLTYPNQESSLDKLEADLAAFASKQRVEPKAHSALQLCLDEALSNILAYAFAPGEQQTIELELSTDAQGVTAVLCDAGKPFDPLREARPNGTKPIVDAVAKAREPEPGMGVFLMRRLLDELHYVRQNGRNVLRLRKRFEDARKATVAVERPSAR
ncbi:MAG: ATP-binding protein [Opitutales bacterium]